MVQHLVAAQELLRVAVVVGPLLVLLVQPRRLSHRRVGERVADRLRTLDLFFPVARLVVLEVPQPLQRPLLLVVAGLHRLDDGEHGEVDRPDSGRADPAQRVGDRVAPVAALCDEPVVAEPAHQLDPRARHPLRGPPRSRRLLGQTEAGQRGQDDVEGVPRIAAVGSRVGQQRRGLQELEHRSRPAVRDHQRRGVGLGRAQVQEVDVEVVDPGRRRIERVQAGLARTPVVGVPPVLAQRLQSRHRRALAPVVDRLPIGPAGARQPLTQIVERGVGEEERLRSYGLGHGRSPCR